MSAADSTIVASRLGYGISDADQHFYEATDSITKYLDPKHRHAFRWIEVDGRQQLLLNDKLYKLIPNPTYDPVSPPGSMEQYFRGHNPEGKTLGQIAGPMRALDPSYRYREPRMRVLDQQQHIAYCAGRALPHQLALPRPRGQIVHSAGVNDVEHATARQCCSIGDHSHSIPLEAQ